MLEEEKKRADCTFVGQHMHVRPLSKMQNSSNIKNDQKKDAIPAP